MTGTELFEKIVQEKAMSREIVIEFCLKNEDGSPSEEVKRGYVELAECRLGDSWQNVYIRCMEE